MYVTDEKDLIMELSMKWVGNPIIIVAVKASMNCEQPFMYYSRLKYKQMDIFSWPNNKEFHIRTCTRVDINWTNVLNLYFNSHSREHI